MIFHQLVSGAGAYLLVAGFGWGAFAAASCGTTIALCGYMFSLQKNFSLVASASWLPLIIWALVSIEASSSPARQLYVSVCAFAVFMLVASGRPEIALPALLIICSYLACQFISCLFALKTASSFVRLLWQLAAVACGLTLAAPVILPALEWTALSPRSHGLSVQEVLAWSANWYDCLTMILPQPLGDLNLIDAKHLSLVATRAGYIPFLSAAYVGPFVFTLAIWGSGDKRWPQRWLVLSAACASVVAALGANTPLVPALISIMPVLGVFRYPIKLIVLLVWCLAILAARGAYCLLGPKPGRAGPTVAWSIWLTVAAASILVLGAGEMGRIEPRLVTCLGGHINSTAAYLIGQRGLLTALLGLIACLIGYLRWHNSLSPATTAGMFLAAVAASQLTWAFSYARHGTVPAFFACQSPVAAAVAHLAREDGAGQQFRILPLYFDPLTFPSANRGKTAEETNASFYQYGRQLLLPNCNMDCQLSSSFGYEAAETADYRQIFSCAYRDYQSTRAGRRGNGDLSLLAHFCQMTATRYVFTQSYQSAGSNGTADLGLLDSRLFTLAYEDRALNVRIYRLKLPLPRAYICSHWQWSRCHEEAVSLVAGESSRSFNPAAGVVLELPRSTCVGAPARYVSGAPAVPAPERKCRQGAGGVGNAVNLSVWGGGGSKAARRARPDAPLRGPLPTELPALGGAGVSDYMEKAKVSGAGGNINSRVINSCPVTFLADEPDHILLSVKADRFCCLVLADHFYPGWQATVDNVPCDIYRANAVTRALFVQPGIHRIQFDYRPQSLYTGQNLAGLALITILLLCVISGWLQLFSAHGRQLSVQKSGSYSKSSADWQPEE